MGEGAQKFGLPVVVGLAFFAGVVGALAVFAATTLIGPGTDDPIDAAPTGLELIDQFSCKKGSTKVTVLRGVPDNFDRTELEPAEMRPEAAALGAFRETPDGKVNSRFTRQYDEGGADRLLIDQMTVPRGIVSGSLLIGLKPAASNDNDSITFADIPATAATTIPKERSKDFTVATSQLPAFKLERTEHLFSIDLEEFVAPSRTLSFIDYLNSTDRPETIDFRVSDDTIVDFAALLLCQEPTEKRAVSMREFRAKLFGPDLSFLSCDSDQTKSRCEPYLGDTLCSAPTPIACYKDGQRKRPEGLLEGFGFNPGFFVGGEVRLSRPVPPGQFTTLADVDSFCAAEHGKGWRTLEFNESGTSALVSYSNIPVGSKAVVNISNQPYANCWDRPKSVYDQ